MVFLTHYMKKIVFGLTSILSITLLVKIVRILVNDYSRLTEYGFGYLTGLVILFLVLGGLSYWLIIKIIQSKG